MKNIGTTSPLKVALHKIGLYPPRTVYNRMRYCLCQPGHEEELKGILKKYPDAVRWEKEGDMQPVAYAMWQKQLGSVEALIKADPSIMKDSHPNGGTVLARAVSEGDEKLYGFLRGLGADPHEIDKDGNNFLHRVAIGDLHGNMIPLLLAEGLDPKLKNNKGETPLMVCVKHGGRLFDAFFKLDGDIHQRDGEGNTLIMATASYHHGNPGLIPKLLALGADIEAKDPEGRTALDRALAGFYPENAMALIEKGAQVDLDSRALKSCMDFFAESGDIGFDMLIDEKREEKRLADQRRAAAEAAAQAAAREQARLDNITRAVNACTEGTSSAVAVKKPLQLKTKF